MNNCISINLKKNEIIIKIAEDAKQEQILNTLRKKLPELKKLYKNERSNEKCRKVGRVYE